MGLGLGVGVIWARMIIFVCVSANESAWYRVLDTLYNLQLLPRALTDANFGPESIQMGDNGLTLARVGVALIVCVCVRAWVRVSVRVRASVCPFVRAQGRGWASEQASERSEQHLHALKHGLPNTECMRSCGCRG